MSRVKVKNIFADLKVYGKNYMRSPTAVFFVFIFPLILMLIFGSIFSGNGSTTAQLYVQNLDDNSNLSSSFVAVLNQTGIVDVHMVPSTVNLQSYISQNSISAALLIPANFSQSVGSGKAYLTYYDNPSVSTSGVAEQAISFAVQYLNNNISHAHPVIFFSSTSVSTHATSYIDFLIPGLIGLVILTSPMFSMTYLVSSYKRDKIFRQLSLTPLSKQEWFLSKFIWYLMISALSALEIIAVGVFLFHSVISLSFLMIPFILVGVFMFTSLGILAGSVAKSEESASVVGNVITFPMMFLAGTFFPISIMPLWLQAFAHVLPLYYVIDGLNSVTIYANYSSALLDIIVSLVVAAVIFVLSMLKFSWKEE